MSEISEDHQIDIDNDTANNRLPYSGKTITMIKVSPNEKYLVTYSEQDNNSFVGWNVKDVDEGQLKSVTKPINTTSQNVLDMDILDMCISDDKIFVYINRLIR